MSKDALPILHQMSPIPTQQSSFRKSSYWKTQGPLADSFVGAQCYRSFFNNGIKKIPVFKINLDLKLYNMAACNSRELDLITQTFSSRPEPGNSAY